MDTLESKISTLVDTFASKIVATISCAPVGELVDLRANVPRVRPFTPRLGARRGMGRESYPDHPTAVAIAAARANSVTAESIPPPIAVNA